MLGALIGSFLGISFGVGMAVFGSWYSFRKWGDSNQLGILIVYCRRSKYFHWLAWNVWGDDAFYLDHLEQNISEYQKLPHYGRQRVAGM